MRKVILAVIIFMLFMGIANASSINGTFEENPIVKVFNNGDLIVAADVPAIIYKGRTMVPMSFLKSLGVGVEWDQNTYSIRVTMPTPSPTSTPSPKKTISSISKALKSQGVSLINYMTNGDDINTVTFYTDYSSTVGANKNAEFSAILNNGVLVDADVIEIYYTDKYVFSVPSSAVNDFINGKIDGPGLQKFYKFENSVVDVPKTSIEPTQVATNTQSPPVQQQATPKPTNAPISTNTVVCTALKNNQALALFDLSNRGDPFSGAYQEDLRRLKASQALELAANGCS